MEIIERKQDGVTVLEVRGRLDSNTASELEEKLQKILIEKEQKLLIDFSHLDFLSSAGLRVLLWGMKTIRAAKGKLALSSLKSNVQEVLDISGFNATLPYFMGMEDAVFFLYQDLDTLDKSSDVKE
ncbi:MAG: STAS domain-containing protein [Ignavibacteria bacterium]|nr:STAS domain-containing protein [Ignavibacteria bacterium]